MYLSTAYIAWALAFHGMMVASFSVAAKLQPNPQTASLKPQDNGILTLQTPNSTLLMSSLPAGIDCYISEQKRPLVTYESCLPLLSKISRDNDFRRPKEYSQDRSRIPSVWREGRDCEIRVWSGEVVESATNQYVAAMAAWYAVIISISPPL